MYCTLIQVPRAIGGGGMRLLRGGGDGTSLYRGGGGGGDGMSLYGGGGGDGMRLLITALNSKGMLCLPNGQHMEQSC